MATPTTAVERSRRTTQPPQQQKRVQQPERGLWTEQELRALFHQYAPHLEALSTSWLPPEQLITMTLTCFAREPKLRRCTADSIITALFKAARAGLAPGTVEAVLLPYGQDCTFIEQYQGILFALYRSGRVERAFAEVVYERDTFDLDYGRAQVLIHKPHRVDRGKPQGAYGYIQLKGARDPIVHYMHPADLERVRKRARGGEQGPWASDPEEMKRKTAMRNVSKYVQLGRHLDALLEEDPHAMVGRDDAQLQNNIRVLFGDRPALEAARQGVSFPWVPDEPEPIVAQTTTAAQPKARSAAVVNETTGEILDAADPHQAPLFSAEESAALDRELGEDEGYTQEP